MIIAAVGLPLILAYILVAADMRSDLSDLKPAQASLDQPTALVGWPGLEAADTEKRAGRPISVEEARWRSQPRVRMLGYMMDGYTPSRDGSPVEMFILLPDAGQFLHPAHRIPNQMVEIWLTHPAPFVYRRLVWVSGALARTSRRPDFEKASYAMKDAVVEPAIEREITRWFTP
jgi:hypothetical protein